MSGIFGFRAPHQNEVDVALDAFLRAKTWEEATQIAEAQRDLLLHPNAIHRLRERIVRSQTVPDASGRSTERLEHGLRFLEDACSFGVPQAHLALKRRLVESTPWFSLINDVVKNNPNARDLLEIVIQHMIHDPEADSIGMELTKRLFPDDPFSQELMPLMLNWQSSPSTSNTQLHTMELLQLMQVLAPSFDFLTEGTFGYQFPRKIKILKESFELVEHVRNPFAKPTLQILLADTLKDPRREKQPGDIELCVTLYTEALQVFRQENAPYIWATTHWDLGEAYQSLPEDHENMQQAILNFENALRVLNQDKYPFQWAMIQLRLGTVYSQGAARDTEQAIGHLQQALQVLNPGIDLYWWAFALYKLGGMYAIRTQGDQKENLEAAASYLDQALEFYKGEDATYPLNSWIYNLRALIFKELERWEDVHASLQAAREAWSDIMADDLLAGSADSELEVERTKLDLYLRDAEALLRFNEPNLEEVVIALEEGRAQMLRAALSLNSLNPSDISDPNARTRAGTFISACDGWRTARREIIAPLPKGITLADTEGLAIHEKRRQQLRESYHAFTEARDDIRMHDDPDFLVPKPTFKGIARAVSSQDEALVYLVARHKGGMAIVVTQNERGDPHIYHLALPLFTMKNTGSLLLALDVTPFGVALPGFDRFHGGYLLAQSGDAFKYLMRWGKDIYDAISHLPPQSTFALAAQQLVTEWKNASKHLALLYTSFDTLTDEEYQMLESAFNSVLLNLELKQSQLALGELGLDKVASWLQEQRKHKVAIVPYGYLGLFPLPATVITTEKGERHLGDLFEMTIVPSARALEIAKSRSATINRKERLILAMGNPQPLPRGVSSLEYSEAEAENIEQIATSFGTGPVCCLTGIHATRKAFLETLERAWLVHLSMHGHYQPDAPRRSQLLLAGRETVPETERTITLEECLNGHINLKHVGLLVLSACETSIIDTHLADEVVGIAAGFLQAGAASVIAAYWAVYDYPTSLLMSRFMQLYLDPDREDWSPARCLAEAQRWLREEATYEVLSTYDPRERVPLTPSVIPMESIIPPETLALQELTSSQKRSLRSSQKEMLAELHLQARKKMQIHPHILPYQDPIYWAAFAVTGC